MKRSSIFVLIMMLSVACLAGGEETYPKIPDDVKNDLGTRLQNLSNKDLKKVFSTLPRPSCEDLQGTWYETKWADKYTEGVAGVNSPGVYGLDQLTFETNCSSNQINVVVTVPPYHSMKAKEEEWADLPKIIKPSQIAKLSEKDNGLFFVDPQVYSSPGPSEVSRIKEGDFVQVEWAFVMGISSDPNKKNQPNTTYQFHHECRVLDKTKYEIMLCRFITEHKGASVASSWSGASYEFYSTGKAATESHLQVKNAPESDDSALSSFQVKAKTEPTVAQSQTPATLATTIPAPSTKVIDQAARAPSGMKLKLTKQLFKVGDQVSFVLLNAPINAPVSGTLS